MKSGRKKFGTVLVLGVLFALVVSIGTASVTTHHGYRGELIHATSNNSYLLGTPPLQSSSFESEVQAGDAKAYFQIQENEGVESYNDSLSSGSHLVQYNIGLSVINVDDESDTILGNITIELEADNIVYIEDEEYAQKNDSFVKWIYPQDVVIEEGDWLWTKIGTDFFYSKYMPMTISRTVNKSIYNTDGFQLAEFNVTFEDLPCASIWGIIQARERTNVNASLLFENFSTDLPIDHFPVQNEHVIQFGAYKSQLEINKTYNFSVVIKVDLNEDKGSAIEYKPKFGISLENAQGGPTQQGFTATIPEYMLPDHVYHASVTTNISNYWTCLPLSMRGMSFYEIHNDVTASETIYVPDNYTKIQWAVDNATAGDTIIVRDDTYTENVNVDVDNVTIRSENGSETCIVQAANPNDHVIEVTADYVNISGFTVTGARDYRKAGIHLRNGVDHCTVSNNRVLNNHQGIKLYESRNNTLACNHAENNSGEGILLLQNSCKNMIRDNTVRVNNKTGIFLNLSSDNQLINNTVSTNGQYGIWLQRSLYNTLRGNIMDHNGIYNLLFGVTDPLLEWFDNDIDTSNTVNGLPVYFFYNQSDLIIDNYTTKHLVFAACTNVTVKNITYSDGDPLGFILTNNSRFENCTVTDTAEGFVLLWSHCNELKDCTASGSRRTGIRLQKSSNNLIYNNYFENTNNAYDDGNNIWNNTKTAGTNIIGGDWLGGNYWSDYAGEDTTEPQDGIGDTLLPYNSSGGIQNGGDWLPLVKGPYKNVDVGVTSNITLANSSDLMAHLPPEYDGMDISDAVVLNVDVADDTPGNPVDDAYTDITINVGTMNITTCKVFKAGVGFLPEVDDVTTLPTVKPPGQPAFSRDSVNNTVTIRLYVGDPLLGVVPAAKPKTILDYYRSWLATGDLNVVETQELLKAADDWSNDEVPSGFTRSITTQELLQLADEWAAS